MEDSLIFNYNFLSATFRKLDGFSWWIQNAYQSFSGTKGLLKELDCIFAQAEKNFDNKEILLCKAKNLCSNNQEKDWRGKSQNELDGKDRERERKIFAFFAEIKAYDEIDNLNYTDIVFISEDNKKKTPDLKVKKDGQDTFVEVKRIQNPRDEDESLRITGAHMGDVNTDFREPLRKKIGDFICDAKEKFSQQDQNLIRMQKVLILDFAPGIDARLSVNFITSLEEIFGKDFFINSENTHDITIWPRKYF